MIISFIGHRSVLDYEDTKKKLKSILAQILTQCGDISFYCGGCGDFDSLCASVCRELREEGERLKIIYVTPYLTISHQKRVEEMKRLKLYDGVVYPPIEDTPLRFAISKRNEWMMEQADIVIAYVKHDFGGAYRAVLTAKRRNKKIINICDI